MAEYEKKVREILKENGCTFVRRGKGDHDIWHSPINNKNFSRRYKNKISPYSKCHYETKWHKPSVLITNTSISPQRESDGGVLISLQQ